MSRRLLHFSIIFGCLCLAVILRMSNHDFVMSPITGHYNMIDTDCYYYLRRLVHYIANFPEIMVFDPLLDWPSGGTVDWPEGFLVLLGVPLKLMGVSSFHALEVGVTVLMISIGLFACLLLYFVSALVLIDFSMRILVLFFAAVNFLLVRFSCLGQVDHHILEALLPPLIFAFSIKAFLNRNTLAAIFLGLLMTYSLSISSSSIFVLTAFFGAYGLLLGSRENFRIYIRVVTVFFLSLFIYAKWSIERRGNPFADNYPSYFHIALFGVLATLSLLVSLWKRWTPAILFIFSLVIAAGYYAEWPPVLHSPLQAAWSYVFGKSGVLQNVSEAFPLYSSYDGIALNFMHINFGFLVYLLPLVWFLNFIPKRFSLQERALFFFLTVLSVPGIAQKRFSHLMVGLYLIFLVWVLNQILRAVKKVDLRIQVPVILGWVALTILPLFYSGFAPPGSTRDIVDLGTIHEFLAKVKADPAVVWNRLSGKEKVEEGIWANPNMGHMLLYFTGLGSVDNSFYHAQSFDFAFKLRTIESEEEFKQFLFQNKIRYLVLADDWLFFELQFKLRNQSFSRFVKYQNVNGQASRIYAMPELMKIAWARMLVAEHDFKGFERLFSVQYKTSHYYNFLRGYRFEY